MTPKEFIDKWRGHALNEQQSAQQHFLDVCALVGHGTPAALDPKGESFCFEKGALKSQNTPGFADVWKRKHFAWEYKKKGKSLDVALKQLSQYAWDLENPPLNVVSDTQSIRIVTSFTNTPSRTIDITLDDLLDPEKRKILEAVFHDPPLLRTFVDRKQLTREAAEKFTAIAAGLRQRGHGSDAIAHFVNQLAFCFFADDTGLLPRGRQNGMWGELLGRLAAHPKAAKKQLDRLFASMAEGEWFGAEKIRWFNGGLFDGRGSLPLTPGEIDILVEAEGLDWARIDPSIFGTLFERILDPEKRKQIGAHYTDEEKILRIVEPVVLRPLRAEWAAAFARIEALLAGTEPPPKGESAAEAATAVRDAFMERLRALRILDPACGSGNFLYLALREVKDLEYEALRACEMKGMKPRDPAVGPEILLGLEISELAAELARTTIWIGYLQWRVKHQYLAWPEPVLKDLKENIQCRDALVAVVPSPLAGEGGERSEPGEGEVGAESAGEAPGAPSPARQAGHPPPRGGREVVVEASWPEAEFIVGNPPFLGGKLLRAGLGDAMVETLFRVYEGRVPAEADLVTYWFEKARTQIVAGKARRAGLVATNSIRGGANRKVLERIAVDLPLIEAWADEPWIVEGAAVRVSLVCFGQALEGEGLKLDGAAVPVIRADLTAATADLTTAKRLKENGGVAFMGDTKGGAFDIPGEIARGWLKEPLNPNGRPNCDVLRPWINGLDVTRRPRDMWIVDFGWSMQEKDAQLYQKPFEFCISHVKPDRDKNRRAAYANNWWKHVEPRPAMWATINKRKGYLATPTVAKFRMFVKLSQLICPDHQLIAITRDDDTTFGILHSRFHEAWSLRLGTWLGVGNDPRYTPTTTFETFPFPDGLTPDIPAADYAADPRAKKIAAAAARLDFLRNAWLNPADLVDIVPEITPTAAPGEAPKKYPDRILPKSAEAAKVLKSRTLTNLYNERPTWLAEAHATLDRAVAAAYGWPDDIATDEALGKLLELNLKRSA